MKRLYTLLFIVAFVSIAVSAQVTVSVQAPRQAFAGRQIQITYVVNTQDIEDFQTGDFTGFDVLYGPSVMRSSNVQIINGKMSKSVTASITYVIRADKAGTYKLPVGTAKVDGKNYKSNQVSIQVIDNGSAGSAQGQQGAQQQSPSQPNTVRTQSAGERISSSDLYITATASKHKLYEQESVLLTYKLYSLVSINSVMGEIPELDGFHTQEIPLPQQKTLKYERVNGKTYATVVWRQYVLFPQKTGKLTVPRVEFDCEVVQEDRSMDPFEAFFGGGSNMVRVNKKVAAPAVEFQVDALPSRPANFSGAVGSGFSISGSLTPEQVDANDAISLRLVVNGTGNMKLIKAPTIQWPKDFESYDPKVNDKTKIGVSGASGNVVYDYTAVPRHGGRYTIPPVEFCYYDTKSNSYRTLRTDSFSIKVAKGTGPVSRSDHNQEDLKVLNSDIRYIRTGDVELKQENDTFFGSLSYLSSYGAAVLAFLAALGIFFRQARANANVAHRRGKKAGKAAAKRLKSAAKLLRAGQAAPFYDEVMRALWGYVGDKLNLPVTQLNKDNVGEELAHRGVSDEVAQNFLRVLGDCEFARFAPGDPGATMDKLFADATDVINQLDNAIR